MVDKSKPLLLFRYPGTNFFEEGQENIFFGREKESSELLHAIKAHEVFVIFADSGIGKTSLLNAKLIPKFKSEQFLPVRFRFQDSTIPPLSEIRKKLDEYLPAGSGNDSGKKLWELYKSADFGRKKVLFIFDQFEEFFNHPKPERDLCLSQLSDLISGYLPDYISQEMRAKFRTADPTEKELLYYSPTGVKFLFLIRADKLNLLDDLSKEIPLILRNRFHLKPLTETQAKEAILKPAELPQNGFATPPLHLEHVCDHICHYLKNEDGEVESFQLQILCRELEKRKIKEYEDDPLTATLTITEEELGGDTGMSNIIQNYYVNQLELIPDKDYRMKATLLIEDELIIDKRRISLPEKFLTNKGYPESLLNYLVDNTRLIRGDRINKERYFEISHDKLLAPILQSRQARVEEDENTRKIKELERQKKEEEDRNKELERQKEKEEKRNMELQLQKDAEIRKNEELTRLKGIIEKKASRLKMISVGITVLFIATLLILLYANKLSIETKLSSVQSWITKEDYVTARNILGYNRINRIFYAGYLDTLKKVNAFIEEKKSQKEQFIKYTASGDTLKLKKGIHLLEAYAQYELARQVGYIQAKNELEKKLQDLQREIDDEFKLAVGKMVGFDKAEGEEDAGMAYFLATQLIDKATLDKESADYYHRLLNEFKLKHRLG